MFSTMSETAVTYGTLTLTESSPPQSFTEPLTVEEMLSYLKVPSRAVEDTSENLQIASHIRAARKIAETAQGFDLVIKQWDQTLDTFPGSAVELLRGPVVSVDSLLYRNWDGSQTVMVEGTNFLVDKTRGILTALYNQTWPDITPWPSSSLVVRFTSGIAPDSIFWLDDGAHIKEGMRLLISGWWNQRIPYDVNVAEIPYGITACLSSGSIVRAR